CRTSTSGRTTTSARTQTRSWRQSAPDPCRATDSGRPSRSISFGAGSKAAHRSRYVPAMSSEWPQLPFDTWSATCDTLHAHTQVLGKLAVVLAPPEPQLQHAALRLTARGWETAPLPALDGSGAFGVALDLRTHQALVEHVDGRAQPVPLTPNRPVAEVTRDVLEAVGALAGEGRVRL